ncbi:MAG: glycosyltransferase family 4 protein [Burkholderiaceae bacterium]
MNDFESKHDANIQETYRLALITTQAFSIKNFRGPLITEMVSRGVKVFAFAPDYEESTRAAVRALGAEPVDSFMHRKGMNPLRDIFDVFWLAIQLRRLRLNATFSYFIKPVIYGTLAARLAAVPHRFTIIEGAGYVFTDDERSTKYRRLLRRLVTWLYKLGLSQAHHVFMLNQDDRDLFVGEQMVNPQKVQLLNGIGLNLDHYQQMPPVVEPMCFILVARLLREKGVYDYVAAARQVRNLHPHVRFLLLGTVDVNPGSVRESEVHAWVAEGIVEWPGQVDDVRPWIAQASVFVLPSYYREGLPRSTQEAMAMGRPIITTNTPGCRETVEENVNGFMLPIRNPDALANAMLIFINHPELISKMGIESRRIAEGKFDVHKINNEILESMGIF